jgi:ribosome-associated toxin RatA of RatAB toxin-antitoxin module
MKASTQPDALCARLLNHGCNDHPAHYRGRAVVLAMVFAVALSMTSEQVAAASISITAQRTGDTIDIKASALLKADTATAWRVLTDYDRYPEFIPDLRVSRVIARRGAIVTVEQSGDATLWMFRIPVDITYEITESPPNRLHSHAIAGSLRALESSYVLTPTELGARLDYSGHIASGYQLLGRIEQIAVRRNVARQFQALADEIERRSAGDTAQSAGASR